MVMKDLKKNNYKDNTMAFNRKRSVIPQKILYIVQYREKRTKYKFQKRYAMRM